MKVNDPNLDHEAVRIYRETFHLTPNFGYRKDIVVTVDHYNDLETWKRVIENWKRPHWDKKTQRNRYWNPLNISGMLQEYERRKDFRKQDGKAFRRSKCL